MCKRCGTPYFNDNYILSNSVTARNLFGSTDAAPEKAQLTQLLTRESWRVNFV